jgi:hypothetical protein
MTKKEIQYLISREWEGGGRKVNWQELETIIRAVLRHANKGSIRDGDALVLIDEAIAAYTRRGNELELELRRRT